jgi:hypothetical protein
MEAQNGTEKKGRHRSPNYPSLALPKAMELAKILFDVHGKHSVALEVAAKDWGLTATSSYIGRHVAALISYGLVDMEGIKDARKLKISDLAFNIFIDNRHGSRDRDTLIREAALKPEMFQKLWEAHEDKLPVDHVLEYELKKDHNFNPNSVFEFIKIFKETLDFAKVYESDMVEAEYFPAEEGKMIAASDKISVKESAIIRIPSIIPLPDEREIANYPIGQGLKARILVSGKFPLTQRAIEKLVALLELNKEDLPEGDDEEIKPS